MFEPVFATTFIRPMGNGRTKPCLIIGKDRQKSNIELIVKLSAGCDQKEFTLIIEAIAAFLAVDLGLPIPEPRLVEIDPLFVQTLKTEHSPIKMLMQHSMPYAFGSTRLPNQFGTLTNPLPMLNEAQTQVAADIFAFDMLIKNSDRIVSNPNCLSNGTQFAIYDHDTSFIANLFSTTEPWHEGYLDIGNTKDHVFYRALKGKVNLIDFTRFTHAWQAIDNQRLDAYREALPKEWLSSHIERTNATLKFIADIRDNIAPALNEVLRVLK